MIREILDQAQGLEYLAGFERRRDTKRECYAYKKKYDRGEDEAEAAVVIDTDSEDDALSVSDRWHHDKLVIDYGYSYHLMCWRDWFHTF